MADKRIRSIARWLIAPLLVIGLLILPAALGSDGAEGPFMNATALKRATVAGDGSQDYLGNNACGDCGGDPVNLPEGELLYSRTDLAIPGMLSPLDISFRYRSRRNYNSHWGFGWYLPYEMRVFAMAGGDVMWRIGTGEEKTFIKSGSTYTPPADHHVTLTQQMDGSWILREKGGTQYLFSVEGVLTEINDRNNNTLQFVYETDAFGAKTKEPISGSSGNIVALDYRLIQIVGTLGKSVYFTYYGSGDGPKNGRLKTLSDDFSRTVGYDYDSVGNLVSVTSPVTTFQDGTGTAVTRGRVTTFAYSSGFRSSQPGAPEHPLDHNLLTVTDDRGMLQLASQYDSSDRVQSQSYNGGTTTFTYTTTTDGRITSVDEVDNNGFVHRHALDTNGNPTTISTQSSGIHPTLSTGAFYGTNYTYDSAQQVTEIKEQLGNGVEFTYDSQGNTLERRAKTNVTAANSGSDIVSTYTYESTFNRVKTATDPLGNVTTFYYDYEEATLGDENGDGITTQAAGNLVRVDQPNATLPDGTTQTSITFKFWYNAYGQLIRTVDPEGHVVERQYYGSGTSSFGRISKVITDPSGLALTTEYTYDGYGFPATLKDARGNTTTYVANALGEMLESDAPLNAADRYTYDANGNMVKSEVHNLDETGVARTPEWITSLQVFDTWNQLSSITEDVSGTTSIATRTTTFEYDGLSNLKKTTSPEGRVCVQDYDENGLNWRTTVGAGSADASSSLVHVDNNWRITQSIDGRRGQTSISYDLFDRITSITDPAGNASQADWDKRNEMTEQRRYNGASTLALKTDFTYDSLGRLTKQKQLEAGGSGISESWFEFDKNSLIRKTRTPRGNVTTLAYNAANRHISSTDAAGNSVSFTLDSNGNPTAVTENETESGETFVTHATWDALNRVISRSAVDRLSSTHEPATSFAYDSRCQLVGVTDAIGRKMLVAYDLVGRPLSREDDATGLAVVTQYAYDNDDLVTSLTDAASNTTTWSYDRLGRRKRADYPTGLFEAWTYDAQHNVGTHRSQDGVITDLTYDANNRLKSRAAPNLLEEFTWNGLGEPLNAKVTQFATVTSNVAYSYDGFGRVVSEAQGGYSVSYAYDLDHNLTQITYPDSYSSTQTYDSLDRLSGVSDTGGAIASYAFAGPNRTQSRTTGVVQTYGWDGLRRLVELNAGTSLDPKYGFDDVNRRTYRKNVHGGGRGDVYAYDGASRLSDVWYDATSPDVSTTGYASDFHVTQNKVDDRTATTLSGSTTTYNTADSLHRYTQIGSAARAYDNKGNLIDDGSQLFGHDPWNRLLTVTDKSSGAERARYDFDALGRRTTKTEPGLITRYVYAGARLLAEYEDLGTGPVLKRRYIYGAGLDEAVAIDSNGQRYWAYQDALGSTEMITNASNTIVERYSYDVFGQPSVVNGSGTAITNTYGRPGSSIKNALWYAGSRWDGESGQYHMRARQYEPQAGRFVSRDPWGYVDSPNAYQYGLSSPANYADPFGLEVARHRADSLVKVLHQMSGGKRNYAKPPQATWDHFAKELQLLVDRGAALRADPTAFPETVGDKICRWGRNVSEFNQGVFDGGVEMAVGVAEGAGHIAVRGYQLSPIHTVSLMISGESFQDTPMYQAAANATLPTFSDVKKFVATPFNSAADAIVKAEVGLEYGNPYQAGKSGISAAVQTGGLIAGGLGAASVVEGLATTIGKTCALADGGGAAGAARTFFHYTNEQGLTGILNSGEIRASLRSAGDAVYGDGVYLTDVVPGSLSPADLARTLVGDPALAARFTHYLEIDVTGLNVLGPLRSGVFLVPTGSPISIIGRVLSSGIH